MTVPRIILHIGHGKTGSSAIQVALARSHHRLKERGILYPYHVSFETARRGRISSGNVEPGDWLHGWVMPWVDASPGFGTYVFSSELLFLDMDRFFEGHGRYRQTHNFEVMIFTRHPLEMLSSHYQQAVKRGGYGGSIADFAQHGDTTRRTAALIDALAQRGIAFRLHNYSVIRRRAVELFFDEIGARLSADCHGAGGIVNRSLTAGELDFVRNINQVFGGHYGSLVSDALVEQLPDIPADPVPIDEATRRYVIDRDREAVQRLNRHLPEGEALRFDDRPAARAGGDELTPEQIDVIRRSFPYMLTQGDGVVLRDLAMKYETREPLSKDEAITLMEYAHRLRPHGKIIAGKLAEWRGDQVI